MQHLITSGQIVTENILIRMSLKSPPLILINYSHLFQIDHFVYVYMQIGRHALANQLTFCISFQTFLRVQILNWFAYVMQCVSHTVLDASTYSLNLESQCFKALEVLIQRRYLTYPNA